MLFPLRLLWISRSHSSESLGLRHVPGTSSEFMQNNSSFSSSNQPCGSFQSEASEVPRLTSVALSWLGEQLVKMISRFDPRKSGTRSLCLHLQLCSVGVYSAWFTPGQSCISEAVIFHITWTTWKTFVNSRGFNYFLSPRKLSKRT